FPFLIAVALIDGRLGPAQFDNERWNDPHVRSLMARITLKRDASLNRGADAGYPCAMRIVLDPPRPGPREAPPARKLQRRARGIVEHDPKQELPVSPDRLDPAAVIDKFHGVAESVHRSQRQRIIDAVMEFDKAPSTAALDAAIATRKRGP